MEKPGGSGAIRDVGCGERQTEGRRGHLLKAVWGMRFDSLHQGSLGFGSWGRKEKGEGVPSWAHVSPSSQVCRPSHPDHPDRQGPGNEDKGFLHVALEPSEVGA